MKKLRVIVEVQVDPESTYVESDLEFAVHRTLDEHAPYFERQFQCERREPFQSPKTSRFSPTLRAIRKELSNAK